MNKLAFAVLLLLLLLFSSSCGMPRSMLPCYWVFVGGSGNDNEKQGSEAVEVRGEDETGPENADEAEVGSGEAE